MAATETMKRIGELTVKGRKCLVLDSHAKDVRVTLLWLPTYREDRRVVEALEPYGKVCNIVREKWRVPGMEHLETMSREVSVTLHDAVSTSDLPHMIKCRTPKCRKCKKFGYDDNECYATYATVLRRGDEDAESNLDQFMDVPEVAGANGEVGASTGGPADSLPSVPGETGATSDHQPRDPGTIPVSSQTGDDSSVEQGSDCGSAAALSELGERDQGETKQAAVYTLPNGERKNVAVKVLKESVDSDAQADFEREVQIISSFQHDNIIKLLGVVFQESGSVPWMVFEFMQHGDLAGHLRVKGQREQETNRGTTELTLADLSWISIQVANGMCYLSSQHFVHGDLATRNCLVGDNLCIKISDFGMSRDIYRCDYYKRALS
ncbi:hypothetical protein HPB47_013357 [Ixodes persulcatus]|uniref:Uncharacterized protein n=1 Tax=Ixodes persulcatus TaxID=34615 RepID=A0AC60R209_IXOPE|nr:hypothetical protein HPB47_013357 [Ixodes persulcatus]